MGWSPGLSPPLTTLLSHMIFWSSGWWRQNKMDAFEDNLCLWVHFHQVWIHHFLKQIDVLASVPPVRGFGLLHKICDLVLQSCHVWLSDLVQLHKGKSCFGKHSWLMRPGVKDGHCAIFRNAPKWGHVIMTIYYVTHFWNHLDDCTRTELSQNEFRTWDLFKLLTILHDMSLPMENSVSLVPPLTNGSIVSISVLSGR